MNSTCSPAGRGCAFEENRYGEQARRTAFENHGLFLRRPRAHTEHFWKVWAYAALIGRREGLDARTQEILEAAAIVHDVGIRVSERKYGSSAGPLQEREGPPVAEKLLRKAGYDAEAVARVACLVGRHHTYTAIDGADNQILVEADFLVNLYEDGASEQAVRAAEEKIFKTAAGKELLEDMFLPGEGQGSSGCVPGL